MSSFLNTINELEELLGGVTPFQWKEDGYHISSIRDHIVPSGEYKAFTTCPTFLRSPW